MRILVSFPGRAGDLLWALPTIRAISEGFGVPVNLAICGEFRGMLPLLQQQPYLAKDWPDSYMLGVRADDHWSMSDTEPWIYGGNPNDFDVYLNLAYRRWPEEPLPWEIWRNWVQKYSVRHDQVRILDLERPWITVQGAGAGVEVAVGFTEAWFELKLGLLALLDRLDYPMLQLTPVGSRWRTEGYGLVPVQECDWVEAARIIRNADLFFGDCSALHVLAVAMGKPVVLCEPMEARHNEIFYPMGKVGPHVTLVTGNNGLPTFDARHCADALKVALSG